MKTLLITLITVFSLPTFSMNCVCKLEVGTPNIPESEALVTTVIEIEDGYFEATPYEIKTTVAYECLQKFKRDDVRKVYAEKSIICN